MKNIFSFTTHEILSSLKDWVPSPSNRQGLTEDILGQLIHQYIPLHDNSFIGFWDFKESLTKKIWASSADTQILKLAELTLELCEPYLKYKIKDDHFERFSNISSENPIPFDQIKAFEKLFVRDSYREELINFLILSFAYTQSKNNLDISVFELYKNFGVGRFAYISDDDTDKAKPLQEKFHDIYSLYKPSDNKENTSYFLSSFLEYNDKKSLVFNSCYDYQIILGLTSSAKRAKNPFVYQTSDTDKDKDTNPNVFLNLFQDIYLNKHDKFSPLFIERMQNRDPQVTKSKINTYNQFFLERISNINFINKLYIMQQKKAFSADECYSLIELVNCPLPKFRLEMLDYYEEQYDLYFRHHPNLIPQWNFYLSRTVLHLILCTLPILDIVFHYLAHITINGYTDRCIFNNSIDSYFEKLATDATYEFYNSSGNGLIPCIYKFPSNIYKPDYMPLGQKVYNELLTKSVYIDSNINIIDTIKQIHLDQQSSLIAKLNNIETKPDIIESCESNTSVRLIRP